MQDIFGMRPGLFFIESDPCQFIGFALECDSKSAGAAGKAATDDPDFYSPCLSDRPFLNEFCYLRDIC